jgi:hypothetical protein
MQQQAKWEDSLDKTRKGMASQPHVDCRVKGRAWTTTEEGQN